MRIKPFAIEQWMNEHEEEARWNLGETCVKSFRLSELLELSDDPDGIIQSLRDLKLTYGHICGSPELRGHVAQLYGSGISSSKVLIRVRRDRCQLSRVLRPRGTRRHRD